MARYKAVQMNVETGAPTGAVETYVARGRKEAVRKVLYTRRLRSRACRLGPTGSVVRCPDGTAWAVVPERPPKGRRRR